MKSFLFYNFVRRLLFIVAIFSFQAYASTASEAPQSYSLYKKASKKYKVHRDRTRDSWSYHQRKQFQDNTRGFYPDQASRNRALKQARHFCNTASYLKACMSADHKKWDISVDSPEFRRIQHEQSFNKDVQKVLSSICDKYA